MRPLRLPTIAALGGIFWCFATGIHSQAPHGQDRPPGPALSPGDARKAMTVPEGFRVEIFASEPDIVNPVSMNFDAQGRIWITESLEYPRREPGPGRDRVKVVEDTDADGKADRFTVFAEGLNIPCGVAVGNGGVYVANSPDILFLKDSDGDMEADSTEVVLTGFGRADTHELPNTLTWGPDGWLYGLNGVFNAARVVHKGREHRFDAALWRYHPRTRDFELFAEGTSNPWGLAFDHYGSAFVEACVIDHLYHLAETGYYHRQGGPYPPYTWKIESVVDHQHQKAAYCGLAFYDADVYPEKYRERIFMGNIHGNCINMDRLERRGATYLARGEADFLSGNDAWFMPVAIKLGPDGCFYVLDWYDRYHCYQDANRDPKGIDRLKGRLYRIAPGPAPPAGRFDLASERSEQLIERLASTNLWWRSEAQRVLAERIAAGTEAAAAAALRQLVLDASRPRKVRIHALWTLVSADDPGQEPRALERGFHERLLAAGEPTLRAWGVRAAGNSRRVAAGVLAKVRDLARDPSPDVRLQVASAARKLLDDAGAASLLLDALASSEGDPLIPHIVWRNLEPLLETQGPRFASWHETAAKSGAAAAVAPLLGRIAERLLARKDRDFSSLTAILGPLLERRKDSPRAAADCLEAVARAVASGQVAEGEARGLAGSIGETVAAILAAGREDPLYLPALTLAAGWKDPRALGDARQLFLDGGAPREARARALSALLAARDESALEAAAAVLRDPGQGGNEVARDVLAGLGRLESPGVAAPVVAALAGMAPSLRPQAIDLLAQRPAWARALLDAVEAKKVEAASVNAGQLRRILALKDESLTRRVTDIWGQVRSERNPEREKVIARLRRALDAAPGDPWAGKAVFEKTCAQCHVIFGKGNTVGPDITVNGRETLDALLSNLLDPNLVIGKGYQAWTLVDASGRVLNGLLIEDSDQRAVLKVAGGKEESISRGEVKSLEASEVSLMPEDLEKTASEQEFRDLIAYLRYEEAPPEPVATEWIPKQKQPVHPAVVASQRYGDVTFWARFPSGFEPRDVVELFDLHHSGDGRPFIHPLRAPHGPVLTALRPGDHPWQYGVFTGHASVNGIDFWHEKGWIRSRGLESVKVLADRAEIVARNDWLTQRRGGKRLLEERCRVTLHAIDQKRVHELYRIDFEWSLTPDEDVTLGQHEYGGLAFRPAAHTDRRHGRAAGENGHAWQDVSGKFADVPAGVAILDHPGNPGFPSLWRVDDQGLINPAITARGPITLAARQTVTFRYRLVVHEGPGERAVLDRELAIWTEGSR